MISNFKDKVVVITGGASGIGFTAAKKFVGEGAKVVIADISDEALDAALAELNAGDNAQGIVCDVSRLESHEALAQESAEHFGGINVGFFNAATLGDAGGWRASELSPKAWKQTL